MGTNFTPTKLPYLHHNARSQQITSLEAREVFEEEITRGLSFQNMTREEYLRKVMA